MNIEHLKHKVQDILPPKRYKHTLAVYETAIELAGRYGEDLNTVATAALLHDIAKFLPDDDMRTLLTENGKADYLGHSPLVWHAPVGGIIAAREFKITNQDIINAITYHTTGREHMSVLEKIIYLADYIEPNRTQPGVDLIRNLSKESLDKAMAYTLKNTIQYLKSQKKPDIHPDTQKAFDYYRQYIKGS